MSQAGVAAAVRTGSTASTMSASTNTSAPSSSKLTVGPRCTIAQDTDIRGIVTIGSGTVIHPKAVIHALAREGQAPGRIEIGNDCIIEELVQIVYAGSGTLTIGDSNLFEVGCRIEAHSIGSHNTFECKSRVVEDVAVPDFCTVGAGCIAQPPASWVETAAPGHDDAVEGAVAPKYVFPPRSVIYGADSQLRQWSGNGVRQADALHVKHLDHLRRSAFRV